MSFNKDIPSHFHIDNMEFDLKLSISIQGIDRDERDNIMNSLYIDLFKDYEPIGCPIEETKYTTTRNIFLKKNK
jgi:hypothetical protein